MDKAVILGVYDFISFHVCKALLDKGYEVTGVQFGPEKEIDFIDDKRFEIGRNANYTEYHYTNWIRTNEGTETIVLSVYDWYMTFKEYLLNEPQMKELLSNYFTKTPDRNLNIILLAPSQMLTETMDNQTFQIIKEFITKLKESNHPLQLFYLPSVFGPWQPEFFLYQHTIISKMQRQSHFKGLREDTGDALYIIDAVEMIIALMEGGQSGSYLLESGINDQWEIGGSYLQVEKMPIKNRKIREQNEVIVKKKVNQKMAISEGINKQIEQTKRLY